MHRSLSIEEQQWLLIVRARGATDKMPDEIRAALHAKGMLRDGDELSDVGVAYANSIGAADVDRYKTPTPK